MSLRVCTLRAGELEHPLPQGESGQEQFCGGQQGKMGRAGMSEEWGLIFSFWKALLLPWPNNNIINNYNIFSAKFIKRNCIGCLWKVLAAGGLQEWSLWEEAGAAPWWTWPAPMDTAEPLSQGSGSSGNTCLRKNRKWWGPGLRSGKSEKQQRELQVHRRRRGKRSFRVCSRDSSAAHG